MAYQLRFEATRGQLGHWPLVALGCVLLCAQACAARRPPSAQPPPAPTQLVVSFVATAYCHGTTTAAGVGVRDGVVAADPQLPRDNPDANVRHSSGTSARESRILCALGQTA